ncbi:gliding motility-associated C-terminal domain-containing protein [Fibrisoma montanum]|uniref:Gliding motility-associated C-terminal domain-containing protein n=1 Tax=Fibrisoma montanum TaxID=2305895 RepID=A0A418MAK2_9BACT|nr:gliding motility-associated C-terminal domain-containing protein [Fibrisoma montanum]RIV23394.1 gliding motility-associated C-terminal domain-containing protein [Fibrisoma montanum]
MMQFYRSGWWRVWLIGFWLISCGVAQATHIVGGELELRYLGVQSPFSHRIILNLYFDDIKGDQGADDGRVSIGIYAKRNNRFIGFVALNRVSSEYVPYTNSVCQSGELRTRLIRHSVDLNLDPNLFNDAAGYYMSWERCCRNQSVVNIQDPGGAGSTFYLEFPAIGAGSYRTNSSPVFTIPKGDYACINQPFTLDFSAKDPDGDSLTYALVTPYNGFSSRLDPNPGALNRGIDPTFYPGPYPPVTWNTGLSEINQISGSQPLRVNARTGQLTVTPNRVGLHVFSVQVDEFRRGVRIGRVRRDYQVLVIDCAKNDPPKVLLRPDGQSAFYTEGAVLTINEKDQNCLNLFVTDPNPNQRIQVINMSGSLPGLTITPGQLLTRTNRDTLRAQFCFGRCVGQPGQPVTLMLRVTDEGCPQGLSDTLTVRLNIVPDANQKPDAATDLTGNQSRVTVGSSLTFNAFGNDPDNDEISIQAVGRGFALSQAGMSFSSGSGTGKVSRPFTWKPTCTQATQSEYLVDFIVTDTRCNRNLRDTVTVKLSAVGLPSQPPSIRTTLNKQVVELTVSPTDSAGAVAFDVLANDADRDTLRLFAAGRGFDYTKLGMTFAGKTGLPTLQSAFQWRPTCELLNGQTEASFTMDFVTDDRSCQPKHTDTTTITFVVKDRAANFDLTVPNVFTPNNDGINDFFAVKDMPEGNCVERFKTVEILNRWGRVVFTSTDPKFRWYGTDYPAGTYYYLIQTTKRSFKGSVTLLK